MGPGLGELRCEWSSSSANKPAVARKMRDMAIEVPRRHSGLRSVELACGCDHMRRRWSRQAGWI